MTPLKSIFIGTLFLASSQSFAESFQGITAQAELGEIRAKFPLASITPVKAAWVRKEEAFFLMKGDGFPGELYLAFSDLRPVALEMASEATDEHDRNFFEEKAAEPDDKALELLWMRWMPADPIPLTRYISKYGKAEKSGFGDSDMRPYASWPSKAMVAHLSDDQKRVLGVEFSFTDAEKLVACKSKKPVKQWEFCEKHYGSKKR